MSTQLPVTVVLFHILEFSDDWDLFNEGLEQYFLTRIEEGRKIHLLISINESVYKV